MPNIIQLQVMDQNAGSGGHESCGHHTYKNTILSLLYQQGVINQPQYDKLLKDRALYQAIYKQSKRLVRGQGADYDLSLPNLMQLLRNTLNGYYDFEAQGLSRAMLQQLDLSTFSAVNFNTHIIESLPGHLGLEEDLTTAAMLAQLALSKGPAQATLAVGINNKHWVTVIVHKDAQQRYSWQFMDSFANQTLYKSSVPTKLEKILNFDREQLNGYLINAYDNSNAELNTRYNYFFDTETGAAIPEILIEEKINDEILFFSAQQYFRNNKERTLYYLNNRCAFMSVLNWRESEQPQEQARVRQLCHLSKFMVQCLDSSDPLRPQFELILTDLSTANREPVLKETVTKPSDDRSELIKQPVKPLTETEIEEESRRIIDNHYDIKSHTALLIPMLLAEALESIEHLSVIPTLVDEQSLADTLAEDYSGNDYVVMLYAHKPHSPAKSPYYADEPRAHTSVLLCQVNDGKINKTLNLDAYDFPSYVDIMGTRSGATANPLIQDRIVLKAYHKAASEDTAIQQPSWQNMNCTLYALSIVTQLLAIAQKEPEILNNVFDAPQKIGEVASKWLLQERILQGWEGRYLTKSSENGRYLVDSALVQATHQKIRAQLVAQLKKQQTDFQESLADETQKSHAPKPSNSAKVKQAMPSSRPSEQALAKKIKAQQKAAQDAVNTGEPKPTEGFVHRLVHSIKASLEAMIHWFAEVARFAGLVR